MKRVLDIETMSKRGKTVLSKGYAAHPFKLANITEDKSGVLLELMIMSSSPGVLDNDHYQMKIVVAQGTSLVLRTQSYQRLFTMKTAASQQMDIEVAPAASLGYIPHPVVPHSGSRFSSINNIFLAASSKLTWGEVITCGRKLNGEQFLFHSFQSLTQIYVEQKLMVRDNLVMKPAETNFQETGLLEDYTHQASLVIIDGEMDTSLFISKISDRLSMEGEICYGVSALPLPGLLIRILGNKAEQLHQLLLSIGDTSARMMVPEPSFNTSTKTGRYVSGA